MANKRKYYGIKEGRKCRLVVGTWDECFALVNGHPGAIFKSFLTHAQAMDFAEGIGQPVPKQKAPKKNPNQWNLDLYPCIERKSYRDPITGIYYKNRCVRRGGPTMTGADYQPTDDVGVPW
ncbi:MAG: viroplasmin family protein [Deltaproteobacteria bacterium]|nr:viroplasmin family protein [Deltaproteobacteria bacterium]